MKSGPPTFWRGILLACGFFICVSAALFGMLFFVSVPTNTMRLYAVEREFSSVQHPAQSLLLQRMKRVEGHFSNKGCDFNVGEFRSTTLGKEDVTAWYMARYPHYFAMPGADPFISIFFLEETHCAQNENELCFNWVKKSGIAHVTSGFDTTYLVVFSDIAFGSFLDYRCAY